MRRIDRTIEQLPLAIVQLDFTPLFTFLASLGMKERDDCEAYLYGHREELLQLFSDLPFVQINGEAEQLLTSFDGEAPPLGLRNLLSESSLPFLRACLLALFEKREFYRGLIDHWEVTVLFPVELADKNALIAIQDACRREWQNRERDQKRLLSDTLRQITMEFTGETERGKIYDKILMQVARIVPYRTANIKLFGKDGCLRAVRIYGYEEMGLSDFINEHVIVPADFPLIQKIIHEKRVLIIADTHHHPLWKVFPETSYIRSILYIPLLEGDSLLGLIGLESDRVGAYNREQADQLKPFASALSLALKNSALYEQLRSASKKQQLLLKELHHRVKNNLALVNSLLNIEFRRTRDPEIVQIVESIQAKIYAILLVHQKLYSGSDFEEVDLFDYIGDLLQRLVGLSKRGARYKLKKNKKGLSISGDRLIPLGLIISEIFTNSEKYADSPLGEKLTFTVQLLDKDALLLWDNAIHSPTGAEQGMGLELVRSLCEQIDAELHLLREPEKGGVKIVFR